MDDKPAHPNWDEFRKIERRLRVYAAKLERIALGRRRYRRSQAFEITVDDLMQHARLRYLQQKPPFDPAVCDLFKWCVRRMQDEFDRVVRQRAENDPRRNNDYTDADDPNNGALNIRSMEAFRAEEDERHRRIMVRNFLHYLGAHAPELVPVAELCLYQGLSDPQEIAQALSISRDDAAKRLAKLKRIAKRYGRALNRDFGDEK